MRRIGRLGALAVLLGMLGAPASAGECTVGDLNGDDTVNVLDLIDLLLCFGGPSVPPCDTGDTNADGVINVLDLITLLLNWGPTTLQHLTRRDAERLQRELALTASRSKFVW